MIMNVVMTY